MTLQTREALQTMGGQVYKHKLLLIVTVMVAMMLATISVAWAATTVTFPNFTAANLSASFQLNESAAVLNPNSNNVLRLTRNVGGQAGSAFLTNAISLLNDASFSTQFSFRIYNPGGGGADGCSPSQLDTDDDGVSDADDLCPGTASGDSVDADGCSPSQLDTDGDGVSDADDACPGTVLNDGVPTTGRLGVNRWAGPNSNGDFKTTAPKGKGPQRSYTIEDTAGCSAAQIIEELELGKGHSKFGVSSGAMDEWVALVSSS